MGYPIHPLANVGYAGQYLNQLTSDNISQRYFNNQEKYKSTFWNRFKLSLSIDNTLQQLNSFYPFTPIIKKSHESYRAQISSAVGTGLTITAISWFGIFNLARRGKVLPIFRQYGQFFKTHRLFRQYLFTLVMPTAILTGLVDYRFLNHTQHLWATHARRMNQQITADPEHSQYPEEMLPYSMIGSWQTNYEKPFDRDRKKQNEVPYLFAPDMEELEVEAVDIPVEGGDGEQAEQEDE